MNEPKLNLDENKQGAFVVANENELLAEMTLTIEQGHLIVYHTGVTTKAQGKGFAKALLNTMVAYARKEGLKVVPICTFVQIQFKKNPQEYLDVWENAII